MLNIRGNVKENTERFEADEMIIDATDQVFGRLSSRVAKKLLEGENVSVINVERAIITGDPDMIISEFRAKVDRGDPHHGPFYPRRPDMIFTRTVRGMIPYKKPKGREAMKRLNVFIGNPNNEKGETVEKNVNEINCKFLSLDGISKRLRGIS